VLSWPYSGLQPALPPSSGGPSTREKLPSPGLGVTRLTGVHLIRPSGLPLSCRRWMDHRLLGFLPVLRTPQRSRLRRTPRAGTGAEHSPGTTRRPSRPSIPDSSLTMCDLVSQPDAPVVRGTFQRDDLDAVVLQLAAQLADGAHPGLDRPHRAAPGAGPGRVRGAGCGCTPSRSPSPRRPRPPAHGPAHAPRRQSPALCSPPPLMLDLWDNSGLPGGPGRRAPGPEY